MGRQLKSLDKREQCAHWVCHVIETSGRTKAWVATELRYPYNTVLQWCSGRRCLDDETMERLCTLLGLDFVVEHQRVYGMHAGTTQTTRVVNI